MPGSASLGYDVENRLAASAVNGVYESYAYLADNKRVWKYSVQGSTAKEEYYLYGVGGQRIASYTATFASGMLTLNSAKLDVYLGGRAVWQNGKPVVQDRLGSVMARGNGVGGVEVHDYFPYGEERVATVGDRNKFGTYHRDQTGLDYADQRYYNGAIGRFLTSDPYEAEGQRQSSSSKNRYAYGEVDPINHTDPTGLYATFVVDGLESINGGPCLAPLEFYPGVNPSCAVPAPLLDPYTPPPSPNCSQLLSAQIDGFLATVGSPMVGQGANFVASGQAYNVDPGFMVALAGAESQFGKKVNTKWGIFNAFGVID